MQMVDTLQVDGMELGKSISLFSLLAVFTCGVNAEPNPIDKYRWDNRLLIVVADAVESDKVLAISRAITAAECEIADRDMLVSWIYPDGSGRIGPEQLSPGSVKSLRNFLRLDSGAGFLMALVGKDGGIKARYDELPSLDAVFGLIDGMPMRRAEMRSDPEDCAGSHSK